MDLAKLGIEVTYRDPQKAKEKLDAISTSTERAEKSIDSLAQKTKRATDGIANNHKKASDQIVNSLGAMEAAFASITRRIKQFAAFMIAAFAIQTFIRGIAGAISVIVEFDQALKSLQAIAGATATEASVMGNVIKQMAADTKFSAGEIAEGMQTIGKAGFTAGEALKMIQGVSNLATGALEDFNTVAGLVVTAIRAFGLEVVQTNEITDIFANAITKSKLSTDMLVTAFGYVGAAGAQAGLTLNEVSGTLMVLSDNGIRASTMGTALRKTLLSMIAPNEALKSALYSVGMSVKDINPGMVGYEQALRNIAPLVWDFERKVVDMAKAEEFFGIRASQVAAILIRETAQGGGISKAIESTKELGAALKMAEKQQEGLGVKFKNLADTIKNVALAVGEAGLTNVLHTVVDRLKAVASWLENIVKSFPIVQIAGYVAAILAISGAVYGLIKALGIAKTAIFAFNAGLLTTPLGLFITGATAAAGIAAYFSNKLEDTSESFKKNSIIIDENVSTLEGWGRVLDEAAKKGLAEYNAAIVRFVFENKEMSDAVIQNINDQQLLEGQSASTMDQVFELAGTFENFTEVVKKARENILFDKQVKSIEELTKSAEVFAAKYQKIQTEMQRGLDMKSSSDFSSNAMQAQIQEGIDSLAQNLKAPTAKLEAIGTDIANHIFNIYKLKENGAEFATEHIAQMKKATDLPEAFWTALEAQMTAKFANLGKAAGKANLAALKETFASIPKEIQDLEKTIPTVKIVDYEKQKKALQKTISEMFVLTQESQLFKDSGQSVDELTVAFKKLQTEALKELIIGFGEVKKEALDMSKAFERLKKTVADQEELKALELKVRKIKELGSVKKAELAMEELAQQAYIKSLNLGIEETKRYEAAIKFIKEKTSAEEANMKIQEAYSALLIKTSENQNELNRTMAESIVTEAWDSGVIADFDEYFAAMEQVTAYFDKIDKSTADKKLEEIAEMSAKIAKDMGADTEDYLRRAIDDQADAWEELIQGQEDYAERIVEIEEWKANEIKKMEEETLNHKLGLMNQGFGDLSSAMSDIASLYAEGSEDAKKWEEASKVMLIAQKAVAVVQAVTAVTAAASAPFPVGFAAMAAMAASMGALLATIGESFIGGGGTSSAPVKAEKRTGTVLGFSNDASESLSNVEEFFEDMHLDEYTELQGIHDEMKSLNRNISGLVSNIFRSGMGFTPGDMGINTDFKISPAEKLIDNIFNIPSIPILDFVVGFVGKTIGKVVGKIFGGSVTTTVESQGITTVGGISIDDLMGGSSIGTTQYADIKKKKDGGWFRSDKTSYYTEYQAVGEDVDRLFTDIFTSVGKTFVDLAEIVGQDAMTVKDYVFEIGKIDLKNLTDADEISEALEAAFSGISDKAAADLFEEVVGQYQAVGEGMMETVVRVASEKIIVLDTVSKLGNAFEDADMPALAIEFSQSLLDIAGGLENFMETTGNYYNKFFSDEEKHTDITKSLEKAFTNLDIDFPDSRDMFRGIVEGIDIATESGQKAFVAMMRLSDSADKYYSYIEAAEKKRDELKNTYLDYLQEEIDIRQTAFDNAKNVLEEYIAGEERLIDARRQAAKSIDDFINGLMGSKQVPVQSLEFFEKRYAQLLSDAQTAGPDDIGNAVSALTSFTSQYLDFAGAYGGQDYNTLFNSVVSDLESVGADQLDQADVQTRELRDIKDLIGDTDGKLFDLNEAVQSFVDAKIGLDESAWMVQELNSLASIDSNLLLLYDAQRAYYGKVDTSKEPQIPIPEMDYVQYLYSTIGRSGFGSDMNQIDPEGYQFWSKASKTMSPEELSKAFYNVVAEYIAQNPDDPYTQFVSPYMGYADGGIISGPTSGYQLPGATFHGTEAIVPLKNGSIPVDIRSGNQDIKVVVKIGNRELKDITTEIIRTDPEAQGQIRRVANG